MTLLSRSLGVNVRVEIDVPADVAPVFADPNALQLALLNLAVNARDAMDDSGVVTIRARNGMLGNAAASCVSIAVSDTGSGMTEDVRAHIFEPFFTTKETGKGSGLGLAQVHGFAEQSGGR
jgi:signal transduction histidine kinase